MNNYDPGAVAAPAEAQRILIVEDEGIVALDIQTQLEALGYDVVGTAASADEAIEKADAHAPDLVLMDIRLEGTSDGVQAAECIRADQGIPVVFLTANADAATLQRAKAAGPQGFLVKPFDERDLHTTIEVALHKGKLDRALRQSHEDLLTILNSQREGCVFIDEQGIVTFLNQAAQTVLDAGHDAPRKPWQDVFGLSQGEQPRLQQLLNSPAQERTKILLHLQRASDDDMVLDVQALDDPHSADRKIVFFNDVSELHLLRRISDAAMPFEKIIGSSDAIEQVFQLIHDFAAVESTVLIEGETGTGKELVARAIHNRSRRSDGPFLALNCAGLSEELAASQLFGHRRGAFTGAVNDQIGLFESASGGTLFLDEIGELPLRIQTTLLRVLEEGAVMRIGETKLRPCDVRILAATNRDLNTEVADKRFRADLLFRIRVARILLPPLRERREDIPILVAAFLVESATTTGKRVGQVTDEAMNRLVAYHWPGNVRELKHAIEFAVVRARSDAVGIDDLPPELHEADEASLLSLPLPSNERGRILAALRHTGGNRKAAAKLLGISRATFYRRLSQLGIGEET